MYNIPGPHSIELFFIFGVLRDRYPNRKLVDVSDGYGERLIAFAARRSPWKEYGEEGNIMVIEGRKGFDLRSRMEDEVESVLSEEGERRYKAWEVVEEVMQDLSKSEGGVSGGVKARFQWCTDGGIFKLAGFNGHLDTLFA